MAGCTPRQLPPRTTYHLEWALLWRRRRPCSLLSSYRRERLGISTNILAVTSILTSSAPIPLCRRKGGGGHCWFNNHTLDKLWALGRLHWAKLPAHYYLVPKEVRLGTGALLPTPGSARPVGTSIPSALPFQAPRKWQRARLTCRD